MVDLYGGLDLLKALLSIVVIDLVLSGDNAVVIGMAARLLPPEQRRRAIVLGGVGGTTKIADSVVSRIAALATREVPGVHDHTATGLAQAFGGFAGRMTGQASVDQGVAVQVGEVESIVNLNIVVDYEASVPQVADAIRRNVSSRIGTMTGLQTKEININVADLYFADQDQQQQQQPTVR